jgi:hypothetical protein
MSEPPSSLEDAVIRAMSDGSRSQPPSSPQPPIVEPSDLRPRSSNPPAEVPDRALPSLPPDAIVPASASGDGAPDTGKTEPMQMVADPGEATAPKEASIPIHVEGDSKATSTTDTPAAGARPPDASTAAPPKRWKAGLLVSGLLLLVAFGVRWRWFGSSDGPSIEESAAATSGGQVTYTDLPAQVVVSADQGLLELVLPPGESVRVDGNSATAEGGRVRLPLMAGSHVVQGGAQGAERTRSVQVRAGRTAHLALDGQ